MKFLEKLFSQDTARSIHPEIAQPEREAIIDFAAERLTSVGGKERALALLNRLFMSDGKTDTEKAFFDQVEARLIR